MSCRKCQFVLITVLDKPMYKFFIKTFLFRNVNLKEQNNTSRQ